MNPLKRDNSFNNFNRRPAYKTSLKEIKILITWIKNSVCIFAIKKCVCQFKLVQLVRIQLGFQNGPCLNSVADV